MLLPERVTIIELSRKLANEEVRNQTKQLL